MKKPLAGEFIDTGGGIEIWPTRISADILNCTLRIHGILFSAACIYYIHHVMFGALLGHFLPYCGSLLEGHSLQNISTVLLLWFSYRGETSHWVSDCKRIKSRQDMLRPLCSLSTLLSWLSTRLCSQLLIFEKFGVGCPAYFENMNVICMTNWSECTWLWSLLNEIVPHNILPLEKFVCFPLLFTAVNPLIAILPGSIRWTELQ